MLVANRGEIAVRASRAADEDRNFAHRLEADESYQIGEPGHPGPPPTWTSHRSWGRHGEPAPTLSTGFGFLSENPALAERCETAGITFVGPQASVLERTGNKARAIEAAREAGLPALASSAPSADLDTVLTATAAIPFPWFVKAVPSGGRGMRRVQDRSNLATAVMAAMREAESAFGDLAVT